MQQPLEHIMVVGTTEPQDFVLINAGVAFNLTGMQSVEIDWRGTDPDGAFNVAILDAPAGQVRVTGTGVMEIGDYPFRFKVADAGGKIGFIPNKFGPCIWRVVAV